MKLIKKIGITVLAVFAMQSCSDDFVDVNDSKNDPTFSTPELTLPVAQKMTADYISGGYNSVNTLGNLWVYTWAAAGDHIWYTDEMQYNVTAGFRGATFEMAYLTLANYDYVENYGTETNPETGEQTGGVEYNNYKAIAKIMKAYHYQYLVDAYGSVPYTEALERGENPSPAYDEGSFIYTEIYNELNEAITLITEGMNNPEVLPVGSEDIILGGDMTMWAKFANSLKLRLLIRRTETGEDFSEEYAELASNEYGFLGAGETVYANPGYAQEVGKQNPLWNSFGETVAGDPASNAQATVATDYVLAKLESLNDPRIDRLYAPVPGTDSLFVGIAQNNQTADAPIAGELSHIGPGVLKAATQDAIIMQSAESLFLQAEAAVRGFLPGDAQALYEAAIAESFDQLDEEEVAAEVYYSQAIENVGWVASPDKIEAIITQKWIALNGTNGFELWIEYRRTGFPIDLPAAPGAIEATIPIRLLYPTSELGTNAENVPSQTNSDAFNSPVFWDK